MGSPELGEQQLTRAVLGTRRQVPAGGGTRDRKKERNRGMNRFKDIDATVRLAFRRAKRWQIFAVQLLAEQIDPCEAVSSHFRPSHRASSAIAERLGVKNL